MVTPSRSARLHRGIFWILLTVPLSIDEFRQAHKSQSRTLVLNIPPMIATPSQMESINTSFHSAGMEAPKKPLAPGAIPLRPPNIPSTRKTLDQKMNLIITT